jgi:low temperature requirement protein LtrA
MSDANGWPGYVRWLECLSLVSIAAVFAYAPLLLLALGLAVLTITLHIAIRIRGGHPGSNAVVFALAAFLVVVGVLSIAGEVDEGHAIP